MSEAAVDNKVGPPEWWRQIIVRALINRELLRSILNHGRQQLKFITNNRTTPASLNIQ